MKTPKMFAKLDDEEIAQVSKHVSAANSLHELLLLGRLLVRSCSGNEPVHTLEDFSEDAEFDWMTTDMTRYP